MQHSKSNDGNLYLPKPSVCVLACFLNPISTVILWRFLCIKYVFGHNGGLESWMVNLLLSIISSTGNYNGWLFGQRRNSWSLRDPVGILKMIEKLPCWTDLIEQCPIGWSTVTLQSYVLGGSSKLSTNITGGHILIAWSYRKFIRFGTSSGGFQEKKRWTTAASLLHKNWP